MGSQLSNKHNEENFLITLLGAQGERHKLLHFPLYSGINLDMAFLVNYK